MTHELIDYAAQKRLKGGFIKKSGKGMYPVDYSFSYNKHHIMAFIWRSQYGLKLKITLPEPDTAEHDLLLRKINGFDTAENIKDFCSDTLKECGFCNKGCVQTNAYKKKWIFLGRQMPKLPPACWGFGLSFPLYESCFNMTKTLIGILADI